MSELLADALVEAGARQLGEAADAVGEADLERVAGRQVGEIGAVDRDFDRLAARGVADVEDVPRGDDQGTRGQRVRRDVADRVSLYPPGQDRPLVSQVVAGGANGRGGDEAVAADVADLLAGEPVAELGDAVVRASGQGDVVESDSRRPGERDLEARELDRLALAGESAANPRLGLVALDRREKAGGAEVDSEDRHAGMGEAAQRMQDRAVATEDDAEVRAGLVAGDDLDAPGRLTVLGELVRLGHHPPTPRPGGRGGASGDARGSFRARGGLRGVARCGVLPRSSPRPARLGPPRSAS